MMKVGSHNWLSAQGERLVSDGKTLDTAEENIKEIGKIRKEVSTRLMPLLQRLGAAPE